MYLLRKLGSTSNVFRVKLRSSATGQGLTGLAYDTSGLIISTICDNEASATAYTSAAGKIETIATLGTFATPTSTKCRFKEVDATNHQGVYELQLDNARFSVASAKTLRVSISGATNLLEKDLIIQLSSVLGDVGEYLGSAITEGAAGRIAAAATKYGDVATPVATAASVNQTGDAYLRLGAPVDTSGTTTLLQRVPQIISMAQVGGTGAFYVEALTNSGAAIHASGAAVAKSPATLDWSADVSNKPTIGTSTLSAADVWGYTTRVLTANTNLGLPASWPASWPANWNWSTIAIGDITSTGGKVTLDSSGYVTYANTAPPSVDSIADGVWNEALSGHATGGSAGAALSAASAAGDPWGTAVPGAYGAGTAGYVLGTNLNATVSSRGTGTALDASGVRSALGMSTADLDTQLDAILAASTPAGGSYTQTVTVTCGGVAVPNASVEILSGSVLIDRQTTNVSGVATPSANAGTYTLRVTATGYASSTTTVTVTAAAARAVSLTAITLPVAGAAGTVTAYGYCRVGTAVASGVAVYVQQLTPGDQQIYDDSEQLLTSSVTGLVSLSLWADGSTYRVRRGTRGDWSEPFVPSEDNEGEGLFLLPGFLGHE